jgi:hypothetical protein
MRLADPASLRGAPARAGTVRVRCAPVHRIDRQARINRENLQLRLQDASHPGHR